MAQKQKLKAKSPVSKVASPARAVKSPTAKRAPAKRASTTGGKSAAAKSARALKSSAVAASKAAASALNKANAAKMAASRKSTAAANKSAAKAASKTSKLVAKTAAKKATTPRKPVLVSSKAAAPKSASHVKPAAKPATHVRPLSGAKSGPAAAKPTLVKTPMAAAAIAKAHAAHSAQTGVKVSQPQRAVPASVNKLAGQRISAPAPAQHAASAATPKALAEKAAAARGMMAAHKKPVSVRHGFKTNEFVVYPAHGVGRIVGIEEQEIAGMSLELFVITFDKEKLTLRVPTGKLASVGMRKLAEDSTVKRAMETLKGRARVKRQMWSRRAQEYVAKINSGDLISIAEVVRDLYRSEAQPEQSYSERQLYEDALERFARELAAVEKMDERGAVQRIVEILSKSAKGRRIAAEEAASAESGVKAA